MSKKAETETDMAAWEETERLLNELVPELNLRLLLETEPSTRLLWVDSVTVTAYEAAPVTECPKSRSLLKTFIKGGGPAGRIWKRLIGTADKPRFFKK